MTAGELRRALRGVPAAMPVFVHASELVPGEGEIALVQPVHEAAREKDLNDEVHFIIRAFELPSEPATGTRTVRHLRLVPP